MSWGKSKDEMKKQYEKDTKRIESFFDRLIAKKDFVISHNGYKREIKAGDDISDVPSTYHQNLKTENVI